MNVLDFPRHCFDFRALARNRALSLHLPPGSRVRAHSGTLWLTQEGLVEDVMLAPGENFEVKRQGLIVLNAIAEPGSVCIEKPQHTIERGVIVTPELVSAIEAKARRLRQQEIARLLGLAGRLVLRIMYRISNLVARTK